LAATGRSGERMLASFSVATGGPAHAEGPWPSLTTPAPAHKGGEKDGAIVISIGKYQYLPPIAGASENGRSWYQWFTRSRGIPAGRAQWLKNNDATPNKIRQAVNDLLTDLPPGGTLWIVYIGHGAANDSREGYLIGPNAQEEDAEFFPQSLKQSELLELAEKGPQAQTMVIVDSCFSGRTTEGAPVRSKMATIPASRPPVSARTTFLAAGKSNEFAGELPGEQRPAFSYLVLGGLRGWADQGVATATAMAR